MVAIAVRPDGHGTFRAITETGVNHTTGLYSIKFELPQTVNVQEIHGTLNVVSWCEGNGLNSSWDAGGANGTIEKLLAGKTYTFKNGDSPNFTINQVMFPQPVPIHTLRLDSYNDLCATSTINWTLTGSF